MPNLQHEHCSVKITHHLSCISSNVIKHVHNLHSIHNALYCERYKDYKFFSAYIYFTTIAEILVHSLANCHFQ